MVLDNKKKIFIFSLIIFGLFVAENVYFASSDPLGLYLLHNFYFVVLQSFIAGIILSFLIDEKPYKVALISAVPLFFFLAFMFVLSFIAAFLFPFFFFALFIGGGRFEQPLIVFLTLLAIFVIPLYAGYSFVYIIRKRKKLG